MRVIAGSCRGARIYAPKGDATRPTSDRAREAAYNLIGPVDGAVVLDLCAGSGALGIEALSRGAQRAVFVDDDREACRTIGRNLEKLRLTGARVLCMSLQRFLPAEAASRTRYDLVLVDPPYGTYPSLQPLLAAHLPRLLDQDGIAVVETAAAEQPELAPLALRTSRTYGSVRITVFEHGGDG